VLRGSAGSGKTALAAELADATTATGHGIVVWIDARHALSLEELRGAARSALGAVGTSTVRDGFATHGAQPLDEILALRPDPVVLVLDGYDHRVDPRIGTEILRASSWPHVSGVVTTRALDSLDSVENRLRYGVEVVGEKDLMFTTEEVIEAAALIDLSLTEKHARRVVEVTGGIPLYARALLLDARAGTVNLGTATSRTLLTRAALAGQHLLSDVDPLVRHTFELLATPSRLTRGLARLLAADAISALERAGLGSWADQDREWFVVSPVVRAVLRYSLRARAPEAEERALRQSLRWSLESRAHVVGIDAAIELEDWVALQRLLLMRWSEMAEHDPEHTARALGGLGIGVLARHPIIALTLAVAHFARAEHRVRATELLALAGTGLAARYPRATEGERALVLVGQSVAYRLLGRGERSAASAHRALAAIEDLPPGADADLDAARPLALRQLGSSLLAVGDLGSAITATEASTATFVDGDGPAQQGRARLAGLHAVAGDVALARHLLTTIPDDADLVASYGPYPASMATVARAWVALEEARPALAREHLAALEDEMRTNEFWPLHALATSTLLLMEGTAHPPAVELAGSPRRRAPASALWGGRLAVARALAALAEGRGDEALVELHDVRGTDPAVRVARGLVEHARGDDVAALKAVGLPPSTAHGARTEISYTALRAVCLEGVGQHGPARHDARRAVALSRATGCRLPWLTTSLRDRDTLERLAEDDLTDLFAGVRAALPQHVETADLSARELAVLRALAGGGDLGAVARDLHVSPNTVKTQLRSVYRKLGVHGRLEAVREARARGIVP